MTQQLICGVDEVGRGPLAGPVIAAAVILDEQQPILGLKDSKKLSEKKREALNLEIREKALSWSIGRAEVHEIDELNILHASLLAMQRAVNGLHIQAQHALVDGNRAPILSCSVETIVGGDNLIDCISAASIIAKVARDNEMCDLDVLYPGYGLSQHKGYPTKMHLHALAELGVTDIHRQSFGPVRKLMG
ncbi:MAG: ribonuclease HII [Chromatiales bacterium]|jgi:ribonuclease HII